MIKNTILIFTILLSSCTASIGVPPCPTVPENPAAQKAFDQIYDSIQYYQKFYEAAKVKGDYNTQLYWMHYMAGMTDASNIIFKNLYPNKK